MEAEIFWKKVKMRLSELGKKQEWLCNKTGQNLFSMRNQISKQRLPSLDEAMGIVEALGLTWEQFLSYPDVEINVCGKDVMTVPVMEQAFSAGKGQFVPDEADVKDYVVVPRELRKYGSKIAAAYVRGDSMEPTLFDGDTIICDGNGYDGQDGIYTILYKGSGFVKRLQRTGDGVKIISDNKMYDPMFETSESEDFKVIGKVRYVLHRV